MHPPFFLKAASWLMYWTCETAEMDSPYVSRFPELVEVVPDHLRRFQDCSSSVPIMIPSHRGIRLRSVLFQLAVYMIVQKH